MRLAVKFSAAMAVSLAVRLAAHQKIGSGERGWRGPKPEDPVSGWRGPKPEDPVSGWRGSQPEDPVSVGGARIPTVEDLMSVDGEDSNCGGSCESVERIPTVEDPVSRWRGSQQWRIL